ncbi:dephospho-CoA kinase [bacterium]|nr:dephospho-CoA kinase [bacterium]
MSLTPPRTTIVGLTGGVGAGKSTAEALCRQWGVPTADADRWAHEVLEQDARVRASLAGYFAGRYGIEPLDRNGGIDRRAVAARVFDDPDALAFLEGLVHPRVRDRANAWAAEQRRNGVPLAVLVVPLLFESGMDTDVDRVIAIAASPDERVRRLGAARGWSEEEARARMARQLNEEERCRRAHAVVRNDGSIEEFSTALRQTLQRMAPRFSAGSNNP